MQPMQPVTISKLGTKLGTVIAPATQAIAELILTAVNPASILFSLTTLAQDSICVSSLCRGAVLKNDDYRS